MEKGNHPEIVSPVEDREDRSEVLRRLFIMARNIDGFQGKTAQEVFDATNEQPRRELLSNASAEQYCELLAGINGVLRSKDKKDWGMDGVGVTAAGQEVRGKHIFPRHADKQGILVKSWDAAGRMNAEGRSLEEIGMLLGSILVETHQFNDGNGRTSRLIYSLVKDGFSEEKMKAILGESGRDQFDMALSKIYIDQIFEDRYGRSSTDFNPNGIDGILPGEETAYGELHFPEGVDSEVNNSVIEAGRNDDRIFTAAILRFLQDHQELSVDIFVKMYGERKVLLVQKLISALSPEQILELERTYWDVKRQYTEDLIDVFEHPDKPEYKVGEDDQEVRMIDYFKRRIANGVMLIE